MTGLPPVVETATTTQEYLWSLERLGGPSAAMNMHYAMLVEGPLKVGALQEAFSAVVTNNRVLRSRPVSGSGDLRFEVSGPAAVLATLDLEPRRATWNEVSARSDWERSIPFDWSSDFPVRAVLREVDGGDHVLLLTLHHLASDGWSLYLLREQLAAAYGSHSAPPFGGPTLSEVASERRARLDSRRDIERSWWLDRLSGAQLRPARLARGGASPSALMRRSALPVPDLLTEEARSYARTSGVSLFALLLTAFCVLVADRLDCPRPMIATNVANRLTLASSRVMGAMYNTILFDTDLDGDPSLAECLMRVAQRTVGALDHQELPFVELAQDLSRPSKVDASAVPCLAFLMDRYPLEGLALGGCRVTGLYLDDSLPALDESPFTSPDLSLFVREANEHLTLSALWREGVLDDSAVAHLADDYLEVLELLCARPEVTLSELQLGPWSETSHETNVRPAVRQPTLRKVGQFAPVDTFSPIGAPRPRVHEARSADA